MIAGIWPLASYRNAEFLNNEIPGIVVPAAVLDRMRAAPTGDDAIREGVMIAREILEELRPHVAGVQVSAPFGRYECALSLLGDRRI